MASVASKNPFAFLNDNDDGNVVGEAPAASVNAVVAAKEKKQQAQKEKAAAAAAAANANAAERSRTKQADNRPKRGGRTGGSSGRPAPEGQDYDAEKAGHRGSRNPGPRQPPRAPRGRQFDRRSGTGIVDTEKKVNQGWGKAGSEYEGNGAATKPTEPTTDAAQPVEEEEEEEVVKTLDQYQAERADRLKLAGIQQLQARPVESDDKWKNSKVLEKTGGTDHFFIGKSSSSTTKSKKSKKSSTRVVVNIEQHFNESSSRSTRTSRSSFRNERGAPASRGARNSRATGGMNVDDQSAFPALQ